MPEVQGDGGFVNPRPEEGNPSETGLISLREQRLTQLKEQGIRGVCTAWHGTSIEAIKEMLHTGRMPGYREGKPFYPDNPDRVIPGDVFVKIDGARFPMDKIQDADSELVEELKTWTLDEAITGAESYAESVAFRHCFFDSLGMPINTGVHIGAFFNDVERGVPLEQCEDYAVALQLAGSNDRLSEVVTKSMQRKGVVIGILPDSVEASTIHHGDISEDVILRKEGGLTVDDIGELKVLGEVEEQAFEGFKSKHIEGD